MFGFAKVVLDNACNADLMRTIEAELKSWGLPKVPITDAVRPLCRLHVRFTRTDQCRILVFDREHLQTLNLYLFGHQFMPAGWAKKVVHSRQ